MKTLFIAIASMSLLLSACSTMPVRTEPSALVKAACPEDLGPADHKSLGAVDRELAKMYEVYHVCATAVHGKGN